MENPLFSVLFEAAEPEPLTVSELNDEVRTALERNFRSVWVEGEITNFHSHSSGHWYFSLTDGTSFLKAACFKQQNFRIRFRPSNGLQVRVRGNLTVYGPRGDLQIVVDSLQPVGEGALLIAFEQIKNRLLKEGLFDAALKRPIPKLPKRIGVITSPTGAALQDILTVLERRARAVNILIIPTRVQGTSAGEQIARAIVLANEYCKGCLEEEKLDVLIVARGGGSAEDLACFNEELVARAIRGSDVPIISAVGHEVDITIADLVADLRAPTPSAAAEIVARAESEIREHIERSTSELIRSMEYQILEARNAVEGITHSRGFTLMPELVRDLRHKLDRFSADAAHAIRRTLHSSEGSLNRAAGRLSPASLAAKVVSDARSLAHLEQCCAVLISGLTEQRSSRLVTSLARLDAMSPLRVLDRGYSITESALGRILRDASEAATGDTLKIRLARGKIEATVDKVLSDGSQLGSTERDKA